MKKKMLCVLLAATMSMTLLAGCGGGNSDDSSTDSTTEAADAADTDEIYVAGMIKIYFVHMNTSYSFLFLLKLLYAYSGYVNVWKR